MNLMSAALSKDAFASTLLSGVAEIGLSLSQTQVEQFFFTFRN